ncbi:MAG: hypothetical protein K0U68_00025 [Gammaproteobacteria bacterium]|nr:hypothetical protein [Gammaproteobacteria bacterium]
MNQDIKPGTALLIILIFGGILFAKFWALSSSYAVQVFSYMHHHPDGGSYIMINNQLLGFDSSGSYQASIDLKLMQVDEDSQTDFAFFSNGDILVRQRSRDNNFIEDLQRYFRFTDLTDQISTDAKDGLFRCNPDTFECKAFTEPALNLHSAFSITIDWQTNRVFIADSGRHRVDMYTANGQLLDSHHAFRFPNQLEIVDRRLYVADTNHHRLIAFDITGNEFGDVEESFDTRTEQSIKLGDVWPSAFLLIGDQRWVLNQKQDMSLGGLYVFDSDGAYIKTVTLPEAADPFALLRVNDQVLISDFRQDRIYRYSPDGQLLGDFNSPVIRKLRENLTEQRRFYQNLDTGLTILFAASLVGGLALAFYLQSRKENEHGIEQDHGQPIDQHTIANDLVEHWITPSLRFKLIGSGAFLLIAGLLLLAFALEWMRGSDLETFIDQFKPLLLLCALSLIVFLCQLRRRIGISEHRLFIRPALGTQKICPKNNILFHDMSIVIGQSLFNVNQL